MLLFLLLLTEFLTWLIIRVHLKERTRTRYYLATVLNATLSIFLWITYINTSGWNGRFDEPLHIWLTMSLNAAILAIVVPRAILAFLHFTGVLVRIKDGGHIKGLTTAGFIIWIVIFTLVIHSATAGRFNVKTEEVEIYYDDLHPGLNGLTIVFISDLHLAGFYGNEKFLEKQMEVINSYSPDLVINGGDFVSYGWREFGRFDTVLAGASGRFGNFAVFGNHDMGTYYPGLDYAARESHLMMMRELIGKSGYTLLADDNIKININGAVLSIAGITTRGRHGHIKYGDLSKALRGTEDSDFRILIAHDPNFWQKEIAGRQKVELTLSGHTHGMQAGIYTKWFRWSPSRYFYPMWNGLYGEGSNRLYVNRGLGCLGVPLRFFMPPEITVIKLAGR